MKSFRFRNLGFHVHVSTAERLATVVTDTSPTECHNFVATELIPSVDSLVSPKSQSDLNTGIVNKSNVAFLQFLSRLFARQGLNFSNVLYYRENVHIVTFWNAFQVANLDKIKGLRFDVSYIVHFVDFGILIQCHFEIALASVVLHVGHFELATCDGIDTSDLEIVVKLVYRFLEHGHTNVHTTAVQEFHREQTSLSFCVGPSFNVRLGSDPSLDGETILVHVELGNRGDSGSAAGRCTGGRTLVDNGSISASSRTVGISFHAGTGVRIILHRRTRRVVVIRS
mmetsp:Transcript_13137/g.24656  ORF Transcript_13137/g.24656 Transcript_13137/m.24656 type:complete len:283 (+) Transcript_13137:884-1732(+)